MDPIERRYRCVDVFTSTLTLGNPLAVVVDAEGLDDDQLAAFARWTNLSETTFVLPPTDPAADYRVRIFTPAEELPFAGHPTIGTCHVWLAVGGRPQQPGSIVQECGVGLVRLRHHGGRLAFAAPPLRRSGPLDDDLVARIAAGLGVRLDAVVDHQWVDNGPGWCAVRLATAAEVLAIEPDWPTLDGLKLGVVGAHPVGGEAAFEVRAFVGGEDVEDPVTGSLNASLAQWLIGAEIAPPSYVAAQGTALRRAGRVHVERDGDVIWIAGDVAEGITGTVAL